ncbi:MAG: DNA polymerase III subunit delta [Gammaproteobacteria bacterium]|jgi:DNA polymerase III subunit delta|nr:DNA polymerase III subunit delta [Gammaproteobacteria bacterium]MBT7307854.1 DNA polymerase III subunit delta [Gammaproteobacteria bacterium]
MKLRPEALGKHLQQGLAPLYLLSGDEPLLLQEAADQILALARQAGFDERALYTVGAGFHWSELQHEGAALSLFAEKKIVDLRIPNGKPGREGGAALVAWSQQPPEDKILLIRSAKLDGAAQRSKWFKSIDQAGITVQIWPLELRQIPAWVMQRMRSAGLEATPGAAALIAERVEGNLLAAVQEIEKLALLTESGQQIDESMAISLVADSARYDPFQLTDAMLAGERLRALRILHGLREEGSAIQVVLWAIVRDLRELAAMGSEHNLAAHRPLEYTPAPLWKRRVPLFAATLRRLRPQQLLDLVYRAGRIDRAGKGMADGDPWRGVEDLVLRMTR